MKPQLSEPLNLMGAKSSVKKGAIEAMDVGRCGSHHVIGSLGFCTKEWLVYFLIDFLLAPLNLGKSYKHLDKLDGR